MQETFCALFIAATTLAAQSTSPSDWTGVWQGELDGQPSVVLTLARDNGTLEGTLVLNGINNNGGQSHIAVHEAHVLMHPTLSGNSLSFAVKGLRGSSSTMNFTLEQTSSANAKMHCLTCGEDAPVVQLAKQD